MFSASWWSGNDNQFCFCLQRIALYFRAMLNSIDFYKGIFSHAVPVRIIVPWFHSWHTNYTTAAFVICRKFTNGNLDEFKCLPFESNSCMLCSIINYVHCICKATYCIIEIRLLQLHFSITRNGVFYKDFYKDPIIERFP